MSETPRGSAARGVVVGVVLGALAAVSNLWVSLRTGWTLPVMTSAALVGFAVARAHGRVDRGAARFGAREGTVVTAIASAAGYMAGGGNAAALPALVLAGGTDPGAVAVLAWWVLVAVLGTLLAPHLAAPGAGAPALRFPTATAAGELVVTLAQRDESANPAAVASLTRATVGSALFAIARAVLRAPATLAFPFTVAGRAAGALTFGLDTSLVLFGAGALMTGRAAVSMLVGAVVTYGVVAPRQLADGVVLEASYRSIVGFTVWPAAALLVAAAITQLALDAPRLLLSLRSRHRSPRRPPYVLAVFALAAVVGAAWWKIAPLALVVALPVAWVVAVVASRAMGETDVVPTKALAPLAQLVFGALGTGLASVTMAPNLTSAAALHAADTRGSLTMGERLGVSARTVLVARLAGCVVGGVAVLAAYRLAIPDPTRLPTAALPVPAVLVWRSVAELLVRGVDSLAPAARTAAASGAVVGVAVTLLERYSPRRWSWLVPSAFGLGSGMVLPASNSISIALGALVATALTRHDRSPVIVASGLVAGESLVGVALAIAGR